MGRRKGKARKGAVSIRIPPVASSVPAVHNTSRQQGLPLAPLPEGSRPGRHVANNWFGDAWSRRYTDAHPGPVDVEAFIDAWDDQNRDTHRPCMAGAGSLGPGCRTSPVYGTSTPSGGVQESANVAQSRLNRINKSYYAGLRGKNTVGKCCEYVTLPGQFSLRAAAAGGHGSGLRTLYTEARSFDNKKLRPLCDACKGFVSNAVRVHPGLRIVDRGGEDAVYESEFTVQARCFNEMSQRAILEAHLNFSIRAELLMRRLESEIRGLHI